MSDPGLQYILCPVLSTLSPKPKQQEKNSFRGKIALVFYLMANLIGRL